MAISLSSRTWRARLPSLRAPRGWAYSSTGQKVATWALLLAAVVAWTWMLGWTLDPDLAWNANGFVSEYGAKSRPSGGFFRFTDLLGGMFAVAGIWFARKTTPYPWTDRLIALWGACTCGEFFFPMSCSPAVDRGCASSLVSIGGSATDMIHEGLSTVATVATAGALLCAHRTFHFPARLRRLGLLTLMALVWVVIATVIQIPPAGVAQCVLLFLWGVWLMGYAWARADAFPRHPATEQPDDIPLAAARGTVHSKRSSRYPQEEPQPRGRQQSRTRTHPRRQPPPPPPS
ncbi:hypothetical protein C1Y63_09160 [Corynebacterium sp. 13CS0277]|uniref:DUF998 domain-containing protein n=1 Tax=Corynebacterium sp. 13CS0277 TaxID=2071994 RepID=UPI000D036CEA|nr:DUF998 domain-containing protein [Corynebacterium sp. 13CS0277]PRQ10898.1 hypothetical protein C1Y63_09160 [Corynebacterium sp. 13CS0277]